MVHRRSVLLGVFLSASCASPSVHTGDADVVGGAPANGREPAVVAITTPFSICTGALLAPDIVLTARHCIASTTGCPSAHTLAIAPVVPQPPPTVRIVLGDSAFAAPAAVGRAIFFSEPFACDEDIATILLDRPIPTGATLTLARASPRPGDLVRVVGFGLTGASATSAPTGAKKIREHVPVEKTSDLLFDVGEGPCSGDSGGPAIDERTGAIVGVLSRGSSTCAGDFATSAYTSTARFGLLVERAIAAR